MRAASAALLGKANLGSATSGGRFRHFRRYSPRVIQTARGIFLSKTALCLSQLTGDPVRTWERWLSEDRLSGEAVCALIASRDGQAYLDAIASQSPWWRSIQRKLAAADEREHKMQEALNALRGTAEAELVGDVSNLAGAEHSAGVGGRARTRP